MLKTTNAPMTRVIIKNKKRVLVRDEIRGHMTEIRAIEIEMRAIFYHSRCTPVHLDMYKVLEDKWKLLNKHKSD